MPNLTSIGWVLPYLLVAGVLALYGFHRFCIIYLYFKYRRCAPVPLREFSELPRITVQLPLYNELYVVERLLRSVSELDYPREKLQIQVLDDSTDETRELTRSGVERLRREGFDADLLQRENRSGYKAGALQEGLTRCTGEYILILDADFVPPPELLRTAVHFFTDPKVGMIQSRWGHLNREYSLLTRAQALFMDGHLVLEQTARSRSGRFFNFNGTAGLWRKSCIEDAGGWHHDTLTEDLDLSYRAQLGGWKFVFLKDLVTPAELPVEMNGFRSQQHRWTKGSVQTCKKLLGAVWRSPLPLLVKLEATVHLTSNFAYLLLVALCLLLQQGASSAWAGPSRIFLFDIPVFVLATVSAIVFYACARREIAPQSWVKDLLCLPFLLALGVGMSINNARGVLEAVFNHQSEFSRTPKYGIENKAKRRLGANYRPVRSLLPMVEAAFAVYFTLFFIEAALSGNWFALPFLALFLGGFAYVSLASTLPLLIPGMNRAIRSMFIF